MEKIISESIELLKDLISIESFSFHEDKSASRIEKWFYDHNIPCERIKNNVYTKNEFLINQIKGA